MMNLDDSMANTAKVLKKPKLGFDLESYLEEARDLYGYKEGEGCPEGEKMVFGACRKVKGSGEKDFDTENKSNQEKELEAGASKSGSDVKNNKKWKGPDGKTYGWGVKNGKPVVVEWGSVAGEKKPKKEEKKDEAPKK
jgi:hypothetical protein